MPKRILIIEDERPLAKALRIALEQEGYQVSAASDGAAGLAALRREGADLVVLDLALPKLGGLEVCKLARRESQVAILMLTARAAEVDRVVGFEVGADDYVTKPFSLRELCARIKAILSRSGRSDESGSVLAVGAIALNEGQHVAHVGKLPLSLGLKEFELLRVLLQARGNVVSRDAILERIWGYERGLELETRTIDQHVKRLRRKLGPEARRLTTVKGVGYRLDPD